MKRFQPFVGRVVDRSRLDEATVLEARRIEARYLPDSFEEFDEMEFLAPFEGQDKLVFSVALEQGRIMRILLGWVQPGDPDDAMRSLDDAGIERALALQGEALLGVLQEITER